MNFAAAPDDGLWLSRALIVGCHVAHWVLLLGGWRNLGGESGDRRADKLYSKAGAAFAVLGGVAYLGACAALAWLTPPPMALVATGTALFAAGYGLRRWAMRVLGRLFTYDIGIRQGHQLVREGPYRLIRHPSYTGYYLMALGLALMAPGPWWALGLMAAVTAFFALRIPAEERMLAAHFGAEFEAYRQDTWALVPGAF